MSMDFRPCECGHDFSMHDPYDGHDRCWICQCGDFIDKRECEPLRDLGIQV